MTPSNRPASVSLPVFFLMGPTGVGKTDIAIELVQRLPLEVVSVDSAMIYRGLDIGTAKPSPAVIRRTPHRLIDICDASESYSAAKFREHALIAIREIHACDRIPLFVGGTGLYFKVLESGIADLPDADPQVRARLEAQKEQHGLDYLYQRLAEADPISAERIHPHDTQRLLRALEVFEITGQPLSSLLAAQSRQTFPYRLLKWVIAFRDRPALHQRLADRYHAMLEQGFVNEVAMLKMRPELNLRCPSMRAVGYRVVWQFLNGDIDRDEMLQRGIAATRQLAKRQFTWFRQSPGCEWLYNENNDLVECLIRIMSHWGRK